MRNTILSLSLILFLSVNSFSQALIGKFGASQVLENELTEGSLGIYEPDNPTYKDLVFVEALIGSHEALFAPNPIEREKIQEVIDAYQKMKKVMKAPEKLPSMQEVGRVSTKMAFKTKSDGEYYLDSSQDLIFSIKWDRNGMAKMVIYFGKLEFDKDQGIFREIPNLFMTDQFVQEMKYELSERKIQEYKNGKGATLAPGISDAIGGQ